MEKFIVSYSYLLERVELNVGDPKICDNFLEARLFMAGQIMLDLEDVDFYATCDGNIKKFYKDDSCFECIGEMTDTDGYVHLDDYESIYQIKKVEL